MQTLMKNKDLGGVQEKWLVISGQWLVGEGEIGVCVNLVDRKINELAIEVLGKWLVISGQWQVRGIGQLTTAKTSFLTLYF